MKRGKLIGILGPPCSGKSTLASSLHAELKKRGHNSIFVGEAATDFIAEYGIPNTPLDQTVIFYKQLNREKMFIDSKDFVICDSSFILNYFYFRSLFPQILSNKDIAAINHLQKEILKNINMYHMIYYVPYMEIVDENDGIRYHNKEQILKLDRQIKSYLETENIEHTDLTDVEINQRIEMIINNLKRT